MNRYTLHFPPENASLIIRLALEALGQPHDAVLVDRAASAQSSPAYLRLNPHGLIPVFEVTDGPIFESGAILLWLTDRHGEFGPSARSSKRADFLKWLFFISNTFHPALRMVFYPEKYVGADSAHQVALRHTIFGALRTYLAALDQRARHAPFDLAIQLYHAPLLRWCALYPQDFDRGWFTLADMPYLHALCAAGETLPCAIAAGTAEGLGHTPFTAPNYAAPPYGSAL
jgi:glutathione S-transferase